MTDFWTTFRLHSDATYNERYRKLMDAFNTVSAEFWNGSTSFLAFSANVEIDRLAEFLKAAINPATDMIVVREISRDNVRYAGEPGKGFLRFFPSAKKV
ncbi:MAG TPA: hypothetical protein DHW63_03015 [Hyphomonadaceae bacterium]|nr:hypothetical protein [Hyphomonadaceae bacterium]